VLRIEKHIMNSKKNHWVVVVDDSNCTVGVGGEGYLWKVTPCPWNWGCWRLDGAGSPYDKSIFRDATEEEVVNWVRDGKRADVPKHGKSKLYQDALGNLNRVLNALVRSKS